MRPLELPHALKIYLTNGEYERLKKHASLRGISMSKIVRQAIVCISGKEKSMTAKQMLKKIIRELKIDIGNWHFFDPLN